MNRSDKIYHDVDKAREHLEALLWPDGVICPHCQVRDRASKINGGRAGLYFCNACREQFTVTVGTVFERSKIPLNKWVLATHLMSASKTGISAHQLHRMLGITYKSAWFMCHRIREAMNTDMTPMGGKGEQVQVDETYIGGTSKRAKSYRSGRGMKNQIVALVDPKAGSDRAVHVKSANTINVREIIVANIDRASTLVTDESKLYAKLGTEFDGHEKVRHRGGKYVNKNGFTTNNVENFFGVFKRSIKAHIAVSDQHLGRYVAESVFRYSNRKISDFERAEEALKGIEGKRLTYRRIDEGHNA